MSKVAKVQNIEVLKEFRLALLAFAEKATNAVGEADAEVQRVTSWVENEQSTFWASEGRKRQAAVNKAKEDLRFKQLFKSPSGGKASTVDEEKALASAMRKLAEAEQKMAAVKKWSRQLNKEGHMYRGSVQRLATTVSVDVPNAAAKINRMLIALDAYIAVALPNIGPMVESGDGESASRGDAGPELGGGYKNLRRFTPNSKVKDSATAADPTATAWKSGEFAPGDAEKVEALPLERQELDASSTVVIAAGVGAASRIYLERVSPAFPGDSGWYIGSTDVAQPAAFESVRVEALLRARPQFANVLTMPPGALVVIDTAGVAAVLNGADEDIWVK